MGKTSISVPEMRRLLGMKKVEAYWLVKQGRFKVILVGGKMRKWKRWAEELLELYLSGAKRSCTNSLCEKYRLSDRAIQKRKTAFEKFVLDFLKK